MLKKLMQHEPTRPGLNRTQPFVPDAPRTAVPPAPAAPPPETEVKATPVAEEEGNKLIVGPNIKLKGAEITDCEVLVVEGRVEASMNSRLIRIAEGGVFSGKAEIEVAEVRGHFDGELIASKQLVVRSTGKVTGKIRYGLVTIEQGGVIAGDVEAIAAGMPAARLGGFGETGTAEQRLPSEAVKTDPQSPSVVLARSAMAGR